MPGGHRGISRDIPGEANRRDVRFRTLLFADGQKTANPLRAEFVNRWLVLFC